jgi:mono/diheme cytochrome c family protein
MPDNAIATPESRLTPNFLLTLHLGVDGRLCLAAAFIPESAETYRSAMIDQRYKRLRIFLIVAVFAAVLGVIAFATVDVSAEAEPSWLEKRLATALLDMKLRANRATKVPPLTPTEQDLEKGSDIYREQCGFCHGVTRGRVAPLGKSFSPRPPQFVIEPAHGPTWMDAYVIQHGVRWSGMPAFRGLSRTDAWRVALYVEGRSQPKE